MSVNRIVINASPLILLSNSNLLFVLPELFDEVVTPAGVWREITTGPYEDRASRLLPDLTWLRQVEINPAPSVISWDLGLGETEVISYALQNNGYAAMLDDQAAKRCALALGIATLGTGSVLILAKDRGLITSVTDSLRQLQTVGFWISERIIQMLQSEAGE